LGGIAVNDTGRKLSLNTLWTRFGFLLASCANAATINQARQLSPEERWDLIHLCDKKYGEVIVVDIKTIRESNSVLPQ